MHRAFLVSCFMVAVLACGVCQAVEPAYRGPLGNSEEPALRPVKWLGQGLLALGYHTGERFVHGNMKKPFIGSVEGFRGLRRGTLKCTEDVWKGMLGAPIPPKGSQDYKTFGKMNSLLEEEPVRTNAADFAFSWWYFPMLKGVDWCPVEDEETVAKRKEHAAAVRQARKDGTEPPVWQPREQKRPLMEHLKSGWGCPMCKEGRACEKCAAKKACADCPGDKACDTCPAKKACAEDGAAKACEQCPAK